MKELLEAIEALESSSVPESPSGYLTDTDFLETLPESQQSLITDIEVRLCERFIASGQEILKRPTEFNELKKWQIIPGEVDSWGWLSGVLITKKGRVVYG